MNQIKHSKYKNSGLLFELLIRQIANDTLSNKDSSAVQIIKKYFNKTELAKEYKLYQTVIKSKQLSENKAEALIKTILELSNRLNKQSLRKEKYNLIKEIKEYYDINDFFKAKITNYKEYAAIYNLIENESIQDFIDPNQIIQNKHTLLEHITREIVDQEQIRDKVMDEYMEMDKGSRLYAYKSLLNKYNQKYSSLLPSQKEILKEYINNIANTSQLNDYVNSQYISIKKELNSLNKDIEDQVTKIKLNEVITLINPIAKSYNVKDEDLVSLLHYHQLIYELKEIEED
jgi:hypothetical protein